MSTSGNRLSRWGRHLAAALMVGLLVTVMTAEASHLPRPPNPEQPARTASENPRLDNARALAASLKLVNYYPQDRAWEQQWTKFSPNVTATDFATIRTLGATSVRIIVFPKIMGYPKINAVQQRNLTTTIELAADAGLQVWLTLYDNFSSYTDLTGSRSWTSDLLGPYANDPRISAVEIRNEIKTNNAAAMTWAQDQIALVHQLLPAMPVTLSLNGSADPSAYSTLLQALAPEAPDVLSYHYYGDPGYFSDHLRRVIAAAGTIPVVVGEAGLSTTASDGRCAERACREGEQVDWFQIVMAAARQAGIAPPAPWTVFDLEPDATERPIVAAGYGYGLFRLDRTAKPAAAVISDAFADRWPTLPQNVDFAETTMNGTRARAWVPWRPSGSFGVESGAGLNGTSALAVRGTETLSSGVSAWYARPLPIVQPTQTWRARVSARAVDATGTTTLALVWADGEGEYLRQDTSRKVNPSITGWQELTVTGTAPPSAGSLRIHLRSAGNEGTVYFSNPDWTNTP